MKKVWIDWGSGCRADVQMYQLKTPEEMNAFLDGIATAMEAIGVEDYRQFDSLEELAEAEFIDDKE